MADLEQFKTVDLIVNHANDNTFIPKQYASAGDVAGHTTTLQVTNDGVVNELPGIGATAIWYNRSSAQTGIDVFEVIDKSKNILRWTYPQSMLTAGTVEVVISIQYQGKSTDLRKFTIEVQQVNGQMAGIVSSEAYKALTSALARVNEYDTSIAKLETYKANKNEVDSSFSQQQDRIAMLNNSKVDIEGTEQIKMKNLSQEVKKALTGGSVAVVGDNAVSTSNLTDKSVTNTKLSDDVSLVNYPFSTNSKFDSLLNKRMFKDIKIYDADITKKYCIAAVFRNNNNVWRISVSILKDDNTIGDPVALWEVSGYTETTVPVWISLNPQGNSVGKAVDILVNWKQLNGYDSTSFGTGARSALLQIDMSCYTKSKYLANYPFDQVESKIADNSLNKAFLNLEVVNGNLNEQYCIAQLRKNDSGNYRFIISKFSNGVIGDQIASWNRNNYVPSSNIETIKVEKSTNGYDVLVTIDWNQLQNGIYGTNYKNNVLVIDKKTYTTLNSAIEIPVLGMYAVNPQFGFPDYAFFTGNWQKRTLNNTEVMTSTIPTSGLHLGFRGTELVGKFVKDRAGIQLVVQIDDQDPFYKWIDDNNNDTVIATGLPDTEHVVKIFADPWFGTSMDDKHSFFTFKGALNVAGFKTATYPIFTNGKTLFAYGDSFTAGGGGTLANSYATYTARLLGLGCHRVAQGGAGLVERSDRLFIPNLQQIAFQASNGVYTKPQQADLVTINIGTNDTKTVVTDAVYESNMRDFISKLKIRHYGAPIVLMGDWVNKYTAVCQKIGNDTDNVYFVDVSSWSYPRQDDLHPTDEGHKMIAEKLAEAIRKLNFDV